MNNDVIDYRFSNLKIEIPEDSPTIIHFYEDDKERIKMVNKMETIKKSDYTKVENKLFTYKPLPLMVEPIKNLTVEPIKSLHF